MTELNNLLNQENEIDKEIIKLLEKRRELTGKVAKEKTEHNLPMKDAEREKEVLENAAHSKHPELTKKVFKEIIDYCGE